MTALYKIYGNVELRSETGLAAEIVDNLLYTFSVYAVYSVYLYIFTHTVFIHIHIIFSDFT